MIFHSFKVGETDHVNTDPLWICDCSMCFPNCRMGTNQNTYLISNMKGIQSHHIGAQLGTRDDTCCIELFDEFPCLFGRLWYQTWGHSIRSIASEHPLGVWYTVPLFSTACILKLKLKIKYKSRPKQNPACTLSFWSHTLSELLDHVDLLLESQLNFWLRAVARIQTHLRVQAKQKGKGWNMCASCSFWDMSCKKITNKVKSLKHTTKHSSSNISNRVNNFYIQFLECHKSLKLEVKETGANFYRELGSCPKVRVLIPWYHQQCAKGWLHLVWLLSRRYSEFLLILNHDLNSLLRGFLPPGLLNSFNISFEKGILNHSGLASWVDDTPNW